jgi:hypothetical protein
MEHKSRSFKEYYKNISSNNIFILTETWGWFIDIDPYQNEKEKENITNSKKNNKFLFIKNKIQLYQDNAKVLYNKVVNINKIKNNNINIKHRLKSTPSINSKLSDLELQITIDMEPDNSEEKVIEQNNIYIKLLHGFCLVTIILLIVG